MAKHYGLDKKGLEILFVDENNRKLLAGRVYKEILKDERDALEKQRHEPK